MDRDGVVNVQRIDDYVKCPSEFVFRDDFLKSLPLIQQHFQKIIIVTSQQGIAKGICTAEQVDNVHHYLLHELHKQGYNIDKIYVCPHLAGSGCNCRKPEIGMALQAKNDFPDIDFNNSVMIGDMLSDMVFGKRCKMETVYIGKKCTEEEMEIQKYSDHIVSSIYQYVSNL